MTLVATMNAISAFIVGFPRPVQLSTINETSGFVVTTKDPLPLTEAYPYVAFALKSQMN